MSRMLVIYWIGKDIGIFDQRKPPEPEACRRTNHTIELDRIGRAIGSAVVVGKDHSGLCSIQEPCRKVVALVLIPERMIVSFKYERNTM